jgi:asparagine N-glycosylation enzyme membrane subunit Stt3
MNGGLFLWLALRLVFLAIGVSYFVLYIVAARRLRGRQRNSSTDVMFWVVIVLALIRVFARFTSLSGWTYQLIIVLPGIAAAIAVPGLIKELTKLKTDTELI